jgi:hypothetical protein
MDSPTRIEIEELRAHGLTASAPVTTASALRCGVSRDLLRRLVRDGSLRRLFQGVYVDSAADDSPAVRMAALALVLPSDSVAVDHTAAWLHQVDTFGPWDAIVPPPLNVFRRAGAARIRRAGCSGGERQLLPEDTVRRGRLELTTPLRTALDLGRRLPRERALAAMDGLARVGGFESRHLSAETGRFRGFRGVIQLRHLVPLVSPLAESPGESRLRLAWTDAGLPSPVLQHPVSGKGRIGYLDICDPESKIAAEYDGRDWHSSPDQVHHDRERRAWLAELGWKVEVFTRDDFYAGTVQNRLLSLRRAR